MGLTLVDDEYTLAEWERTVFGAYADRRRCGTCGTTLGLRADHDCPGPSRPSWLRWVLAAGFAVIVVALWGRKGKP